jgi:hypothetical protein
MDTDDNYGRKLNRLVLELQLTAETANVRGGGNARFVFAKCGSRAVELSRDGSGWWLECWSVEEVVSEDSFASLEDAIVASKFWLSTDAA